MSADILSSTTCYMHTVCHDVNSVNSYYAALGLYELCSHAGSGLVASSNLRIATLLACAKS
jgi:hypothetical protein